MIKDRQGEREQTIVNINTGYLRITSLVPISAVAIVT